MRFVLVITLSTLVCACGLKGQLYMPDKSKTPVVITPAAGSSSHSSSSSSESSSTPATP